MRIRKSLIWIMAVILLVISIGSGTVPAVADAAKSTGPELMELDTAYPISIVNYQEVSGYIRPERTGVYLFTFSGEVIPSFFIYDENNNSVEESDGIQGLNDEKSYKITFPLAAGTSYRYTLCSYESELVEFAVTMSLALETDSVNSAGPQTLEQDVLYDVTIINNQYVKGSFPVEQTGIYTVTFTNYDESPDIWMWDADENYEPLDIDENEEETQMVYTYVLEAGKQYFYSLSGGVLMDRYQMVFSLEQALANTDSQGPDSMKVDRDYSVLILRQQEVRGTVTPKKTGHYVFTGAVERGTPRIKFYDENGKELSSGMWWNDEDTQFYQGVTFKAGKTYTYALNAEEVAAKYHISFANPDPGSALHSWGKWKTKSAATVFKAKVQTRTCKTCKMTQTRSVGKPLKPTIKTNADKNKMSLKAKSSSSRLRISGLAKGDSIKSVKSSNEKVVKVAAVKSKKGTYKLKAGTKGKATITIKLKSGLKKKITVTVK